MAPQMQVQARIISIGKPVDNTSDKGSDDDNQLPFIIEENDDSPELGQQISSKTTH